MHHYFAQLAEPTPCSFLIKDSDGLEDVTPLELHILTI